MAITENYAPIKQLGNGVTTIFSTSNWSPLSSAFLRVYFENVTTGVQTLKTLGVDYTFAFSGTGFAVTFGTAPTSANYVVISREVAINQESPYKTSRGWQGDVVEDSFDKLTAIAQDLDEKSNRTITAPIGETFVGTLPPAATRANKAAIFDADGDITVSTDDYDDQAAIVAASAAAAAASAADAAASDASAAGHEAGAEAAVVDAEAAAAAAAASAGLIGSNANIFTTLRNNIMVPFGPSTVAANNSAFEQICSKYGDFGIRRGKNGGRNGQYSMSSLDNIYQAVVAQKPAWVLMHGTFRNDMNAGTMADAAQGTTAGNVGNAKYNLNAALNILRALNIKVIVCPEMVEQVAGTARTNCLAWNAALPATIAARADSGILYVDTASLITDSSGNPLIPTVNTTASGTTKRTATRQRL